jgi:uncharacterized protein (DUF1015 family)
MAEIRPLNALHYAAADLQDAVAPPYDVIDAELRAQLASRSPHNVVTIDLPEGDDPYAAAARTFAEWRESGVLQRDDEPALWVLTQEYTGPDGEQRTRSGFFAAVRVEDYGPGRIRPHERTHPGPKEDRLNLQRATKANLSPIFSLYSDPERRAWGALAGAIEGQAPWAEVTDDDGTVNRLWRVADEGALADVGAAMEGTELLIADGHHRYETARVYAQEAGTEGAQWVLMNLVALEDPGLTVFPTHRLAKGRGLERYEALATTLKEHFEIEEVPLEDLEPPADTPVVEFGYLDGHFRKPFRVRYRGAATSLTGPLAEFDTAILETVVLKGPLALTDDDIDHLHDFGYARDAAEAKRLVLDGEYDVAFLLRPPPVDVIREVASAGQNMPPKSTYFFPKVPTGLLFHPLDG